MSDDGVITAESQELAWQVYEQHRTTHGYPVPTGSGYRLYPCRGVVNAQLAAEAQGFGPWGPGRVTGGSSAKAARLTAADRKRISEEAAQKAAQRKRDASATEQLSLEVG